MPKTLDLNRLATVQVVPPTPFSADGADVLPERLTRLTAQLFAAGLRVFLPAAGTGEFHSLTPQEAGQCVQAVRAAVDASAVVIGPVGLGLKHALAVGERVIDAGADALLLMPPVHPYLSDEGFRDYFHALTKALPLPFLAYKRGPVPSERLLLELAGESRLVGVKYAVNDLDAFLRFTDQARGRLRLYCGTAERFAPFFMLAGAEGFTSGAAAICPRLSLAMHAALARGDYAEGLRRLRQIRPLEDFRAEQADSFNISLLKAAIAQGGHDFGPPRPPQRRLNAAEHARLAEMLRGVWEAEAELER